MKKQLILAPVIVAAIVTGSIGASSEGQTVKAGAKEKSGNIAVMNKVPTFRSEAVKVIENSIAEAKERDKLIKEMKKKKEAEKKKSKLKKLSEQSSGSRPLFKEVTLSSDLQEYIWKLCNKDKDFYIMTLSIIHQESKFDINIPVSPTNDYGLFQINGSNLRLNNPYNFAVQAGVKPRGNKRYTPYEFSKMAIHHLYELDASYAKKRKYDRLNLILMSYNMGSVGAQKKYKSGKVSRYAREVKAYMAQLEKEIQ